jgi:hypothetical protein
VPPAAASEIEQPVAGPDREAAEVRSALAALLRPRPSASLASARSARRRSRVYSATAARATAGQATFLTRCQAAAESRARSGGESSGAAQRGGELLGITGLHQQGGVAGDLRQRAGPAGHQRGSRRHVLHRGREKPS